MQFVAIGGIAGILSGLFGIGGGVVIVPALLLMARMKPETATGTSLAALLLPVGALGAYRYYRSGFLDLPVALKLAAGLFVGAWVGAHLALKLSPRDLQRAFAVFLVFVAGHLWMSAP
ncbi:MAG: sulfite exporter TauE/SafE family protein [Gemmatimonadetes bacterium]|nr:sulfite exporter TauE/SafE family protein [Gemmatimonadota bacterium]